MKVSELLAMKPGTLGVTGVLLTDGRLLIKVLDDFDGVEVAVGRVSINMVNNLLPKLSEEDQDAFMSLEVDENTTEDVTPLEPPTLHLSPGYEREAALRARMGFMMCVVLAIAVLAITASVCAVSLYRKEFPDVMLIAVILCPVMAIAWLFMGLINKERSDILSAVLGSSGGNTTVFGTVLDALASRKNKA